jgi:hypothetical protein
LRPPLQSNWPEQGLLVSFLSPLMCPNNQHFQLISFLVMQSKC